MTAARGRPRKLTDDFLIRAANFARSAHARDQPIIPFVTAAMSAPGEVPPAPDTVRWWLAEARKRGVLKAGELRGKGSSLRPQLEVGQRWGPTDEHGIVPGLILTIRERLVESGKPLTVGGWTLRNDGEPVRALTIGEVWVGDICWPDEDDSAHDIEVTGVLVTPEGITAKGFVLLPDPCPFHEGDDRHAAACTCDVSTVNHEETE